MHERIKKIRQALNLTQQELANKIGVSRSNIGKYETGFSEPSAAVIALICREFNVNEKWLCEGVGDMFLPVKRNNEIAKLVNQLLNEETDSFKNRFISILANLSVKEWEILEHITKQLYEGQCQKDNTSCNDLSSTSLSVEAMEEEYIKSRSRPAKKTEQFVLNTTDDATKTDKVVNQ